MYWTELNLSNWREQRQQRCRRRWAVSLVFSVSISVAISSVTMWWLEQLYQQTQGRHQLAEQALKASPSQASELSKLQLRLDHHKQLQDQIQTLSQQQRAWWALLNQFYYVVPEGVYLSRLHYRFPNATVSGVVDGTQQVQRMLDAMQVSPLIEKVQVKSLTRDSKQKSMTRIELEMAVDGSARQAPDRLAAEINAPKADVYAARP